MLSETSIELIKFFTLFIWVLNGFIAGLLFLNLSIIAWLCYAEARHPPIGQMNRQKKSLLP